MTAQDEGPSGAASPGPSTPPRQDLKTVLLRAGSGLALAAVVGAPAVASWVGLTHVGLLIGLGPLRWVVPVALDGAAAYAALLALRATLRGESSAWPQTLCIMYALLAAGWNAWQAPTTAAALFFGLMSLSAVVLWGTTLRALRHVELRALGRIAGVSAHYRPLRWVLAPRETRDAWRVGVLEDITDPRVALRAVRGHPTPEFAPEPTPEPAPEPTPVLEPTPESVWEHAPRELPVVGQTKWGSKRDALKAAFTAVGGHHDIPAALAWLRQHGVRVDRSYAYDVARSLSRARRIRAIEGGRK